MERADLAQQIQLRWPELQREAIVRATTALSMITPDMVASRFMEAGEKYGKFDINNINVEEELLNEFLDIPAYIILGWNQPE